MLDQFWDELRSRGPITEDSDLFPLGLEAIIPCRTVESLALERL